MGNVASALAGINASAPRVDWENLTNAMRQIGFAAERAADSMERMTVRAALSMNPDLPALVNNEVRVCGLEARYLVRGGMVGTHEEGTIDGLVHDLMTRPQRQGAVLDRLLTRASRARLAAAAMQGYVLQHPEDTPVYSAAYRWWGGREVSVVRRDGMIVVTT